MAYLLDTWAWMAYFHGVAGARLARIVENGEVATSIITIAELADRYARDKRPVQERIDFISSRGRILQVTLDVAQRAGSTKWAQRARKHPMGLGDAMIYETAKADGLTVLTGDPGFKGLPGVEFLE